MWGIFDKKEADRIVPEGHRHPHFGPKPDQAGAAPGAAADGAAPAVPEGALTADDFEDTPEDRSAGRVPAPAGSGQEQGPKGAAQASLRLQPFGTAGEQA